MQATYNGLELPQDGQPIEYEGGQFAVPDHPIIPFIEGDGTGRDIWKASERVFDAAVEKAYGGRRAIRWFEIFAGEKAFRQFGAWLPDDTVAAARDLRVSIKGPLTTPVGGGIRSLNVALRQLLDLYACVRPVKYYQGVPSPVKHPEQWTSSSSARTPRTSTRASSSKKARRTPRGLSISSMTICWPRPRKKYAPTPASASSRSPSSAASAWCATPSAPRWNRAARPSRWSTRATFRSSLRAHSASGATRSHSRSSAPRRSPSARAGFWAMWTPTPASTIEQNAALIEPGLEFGSPAFRESICAEVKAVLDSIGQSHGNGAWKSKILINDRIADSIFQQIIIRPEDYSVLATTNLNGDYISDAAAAQVGGLGIAPGANIGDGYAVFEATHGTAPKYADKDMINPGSVILSGVMLLEFIGWKEAARLIEASLEKDHPAKIRHLRFRTPDRRRNQGRNQRVCHPHHRQYVS